jgi:hypothetical protein
VLVPGTPEIDEREQLLLGVRGELLAAGLREVVPGEDRQVIVEVQAVLSGEVQRLDVVQGQPQPEPPAPVQGIGGAEVDDAGQGRRHHQARASIPRQKSGLS